MAYEQLCDRQRFQLMVLGQARSSSQELSSWDTSAAETAPYNPLHNKQYAATYPSAVPLRMKTITEAPKTGIERKKKAPVIQTRQKLFQKVGNLLA